MPPLSTRRALLQTVGSASLAALTGCIKTGGPEPTPPQQTEPPAGQNGDPNATANATTTTTVTGRTYSIIVKNKITKTDLRKGDDRDPTTPANIALKAYRNPEQGEDEVYLDQTVELPPNTTREFTDVFSTDPDGTEYVVMAELTNLGDSELAQHRNYSKYYRFVPGGFQYPSSNTFNVVVMDVGDTTVGDVQPLVPQLSVTSSPS